jgi:ribosomal protein S18 acetylase RimI-like enzyme
MVANGNVTLQPATPELAGVVPDLLSATDPKLFSHLVGGRKDVLRAWISVLWAAPDNNFSHELAVVAVRDGDLLGLELGYPGSAKKSLGRRNGELSLELLDEETLANIRTTAHQGLGYFTPHVPDKSYYLMFLSVAEAARNQGVGSRLLDNAFERARAAGLKSVHLDVFEGNPARRLYERAGMKALVETRVPGLEHDHGIPPHHRMVLNL